MKAVHWAPSGDAMRGIPSYVVALLADEDGKTYGYGYGPGWSMMFGSAQGDVTVLPKQWVIRHDDGRIEVSDKSPWLVCPVCDMTNVDKGDDAEVMARWETYHDAHCSGRWWGESVTPEAENGTEPGSDETSGTESGTQAIILRDIDNRDDDMAPYEFEGTPDQIIAYLEGPLTRDLADAENSAAALALAIKAVRAGDLLEANGQLESLSVHLRRPQ